MRSLYTVMANMLTVGMLSAGTITYTFTGVGSGTVNGTPFSNQTLTFGLTTDTSLVSGGFTPPVSGLLSISGVGQGTAQDSYIVFSGPQVVSFNISTTTPALVMSPLLNMYDLRNAIGPVTSTSAYGPVGGIASTSLGQVALTSAVTYTFSATIVPEPDSFALVLIGVAGLIYPATKYRLRSNT
jgi:hypothetical protein